jgi:hypothetical protein
MIAVLFGAPSGIPYQVIERWHQGNIAGGLYPPQQNARFGETLSAADFNGDGIDDVAVAAPNWSCGNLHRGHVYALYGSPTGFSGTRFTHLARPSPGTLCGSLPVNAAGSDGFGGALAAGDFDANGVADLAVGMPGYGQRAGGVEVIYGASQGLDWHYRFQGWSQGSQPIPLEGISGGNIGETSETHDAFGSALASGDFNGDGRSDLAVGVPYEALTVDAPAVPPECPQPPAVDAYGVGLVHVIYGSAIGLYHVFPFASGCAPQPCTPPGVGPIPGGARESRMLQQGR